MLFFAIGGRYSDFKKQGHPDLGTLGFVGKKQNKNFEKKRWFFPTKPTPLFLNWGCGFFRGSFRRLF
jgi:hypothetical protein